MPTYTYRCKSCSHQFDEWQKISEAPLVTCPSCTKDTLVRVIDGGAGLIFKGSGFYLTDYKKDGSKTRTEKTEEKKPADKKPEPSPSPRKTSHS